MLIFTLIVLGLAFIECLLAYIDSAFDSLSDWMDGGIFETDESDLKDYMDNSEYDWGHNIKNYMEEEL